MPSLADGEPRGQNLGQPRLPDLAGGLVDVILHAARNDATSLLVKQRVRRTPVPVPGLPHAPHVDQRPIVGAYIHNVFFHHLKRFRAIATRYDKTARNYLSLIHLACATLWLEN